MYFLYTMWSNFTSQIYILCLFYTSLLWTTPNGYRDETGEKFLDQVLATATIFKQHMTNKILIEWLTQEQWREYNNATNCLICVKPFKSADKRVCDHNHLTDKYRGPVHNACNLNCCFHTIFCLISGIIHVR